MIVGTDVERLWATARNEKPPAGFHFFHRLAATNTLSRPGPLNYNDCPSLARLFCGFIWVGEKQQVLAFFAEDDIAIFLGFNDRMIALVADAVFMKQNVFRHVRQYRGARGSQASYLGVCTAGLIVAFVLNLEQALKRRTNLLDEEVFEAQSFAVSHGKAVTYEQYHATLRSSAARDDLLVHLVLWTSHGLWRALSFEPLRIITACVSQD